LNFIEFHPDERVTVEPILCRRETLQQLQAHTLIFYTGITRSASDILKNQQRATASERAKQNVLKKMVGLARDLRRELQHNCVSTFGDIIHEGWLLKKSLSKGITSDVIDDWYAQARKAGAVGGKWLGAGTGGFLMFHAPPEKHDAIARALSGLRRMDFRFEPQGSRIIFVHH